MLLGVKIFNTSSVQKAVQSVVSIADKCHSKNENFFITSTKQNNLLDEIDKSIWTFSSGKFIPHCLIQDQDYLLYGQDVKNLLSYKISDFFDIFGNIKNDKINLVLVTTQNDDEYIFHPDLITKLISLQGNITLVIVNQSGSEMFLPTHIENCIVNLKESSIDYEIWQNFDLGWEKVF